MRRLVIKAMVFKNRIAPKPSLQFIDRSPEGVETPVSFASVTRMVLKINPNDASPVTVDTSVDGAVIDYSVAGTVTFNIGNLSQVVAMTEGDYESRLTAIDGLGGKTELINEDAKSALVLFAIRDTTTI